MQDQPQGLLIIWHSRTGASRQLAEAAFSGTDGSARLMQADEVGSEDILAAAGFLFVCPENLACMSGTMKEMFDRTYYAVLGRVEGRPYATIIAAGSDGEGAQKQIDRIATGWRLRRVADPFFVNFGAQTPEAILAKKKLSKADHLKAHEIGAGLSSGLELGIF